MPVRGTNMRYIYVIRSNLTKPANDRSYMITDEVILYYANETRPAIRVACPSLGAGNETRPHHRKLLTVRGQLLEPEKFYNQAPYKYVNDTGKQKEILRKEHLQVSQCKFL